MLIVWLKTFFSYLYKLTCSELAFFFRECFTSAWGILKTPNNYGMIITLHIYLILKKNILYHENKSKYDYSKSIKILC